MRSILFVLLMSAGGCLGGGGSACVPTDGLAPCCTPPEVVCPEGSMQVALDNDGSLGCKTADGTRIGPHTSIDYRGLVVAYGEVGISQARCSDDGIRILRLYEYEGGEDCLTGCWAQDGTPVTREVCGGDDPWCN